MPLSKDFWVVLMWVITKKLNRIRCNRKAVLTDTPPFPKCYIAALDEDPTLTSAHSALSLAYLKLKRNDDALQSAEKALALDSKYETALHRQGQVRHYVCMYGCGKIFTSPTMQSLHIRSCIQPVWQCTYCKVEQWVTADLLLSTTSM